MRRASRLPLCLVLAALLGGGGPAHAGPWPRAAGGGFSALSFGAERAAGGTSGLASVAAEYGLRPRLAAFGWAEGQAVAGSPARARLGLRLHPWGDAWLLSFGAAVAVEAGRAAPRLELHAGRPMSIGTGGWARASAAFESRAGAPQTELSLQAGVRPAAHTLLMIEITGHRAQAGTTLRAGLSAGWRVAPQAELVAGFARATGPGAGDRFTLSLWRKF